MLLPPTSDFDAQPSPGVRALLWSASSTLDSVADNLTLAADDGGLGSYTSVNGSTVLNPSQQRALQSVAFGVSSVGLIAAFLAIYWFCMMRRNFRRDLVLLLVIAGGWKSLWFVLYGAVAFSWGEVPANGAFCRLSGYMLEVGFESCDLAIVLMSLHMLIQIFPPAKSILAQDGLYRIRHWMLLLWIVVPNLLAGLAFINPVDPYTTVGGFCFLPIRPFWYRLALFWIPRYLIWIFITYVAIKIYRHVGREFKVFAQVRDESESVGMPGESTIDRAIKEAEERAEMQREKARRKSSSNELGAMLREKPQPRREDSAYPHAESGLPPSQQPTPEWATYTLHPDGATPSNGAVGPQAASRRGSHQIASGVMAEDFAPPVSSQLEDSIPSLPLDGYASPPTRSVGPHDRSVDVSHVSSVSTGMSTDVPHGLANKAIEQRRLAIQRQLRLLFIYPVVYMLVWIFPSIAHFMNYDDHFAQHPIFPLVVLQIFCLTVMTPIDVAVFCWRERPWRHIPGSDSTFLGSLAFWRFTRQPEWQMERSLSRVATGSSNTGAGADSGRPDGSTTSHSGLLASLRKWQLPGRRRSSDPSANSYPSTQPHSPEQANFGPGAVLAGPPPPSAAPTSPSTLTAPPLAARRLRSGGSDRRQMAADRAYERLALERADYAAQQKTRRDLRASSFPAAMAVVGEEPRPSLQVQHHQRHHAPESPIAASPMRERPQSRAQRPAPSRPSTREWFEADLFADLAASRSLEEAAGRDAGVAVGDVRSESSADEDKSVDTTS